MKTRTLAFALAFTPAACGDAPTEISTPESPRLDGGMMYGGGLKTNADCDDERGGMTFGGGTYTDSCEEPAAAREGA